MKEIVKELKSLKKEKEKISKKIKSIKEKGLTLEKASNKKYITCSCCQTRYLVESLKDKTNSIKSKNPISCSLCYSLFLTKKQSVELKKNETRFKSIIQEIKNTNNKIMQNLKNSLSNLKKQIARTDGTHQIRDWYADSESCTLVFRNGTYAYHESYDSRPTKDKSILYREISKLTRNNLGENAKLFDINVSYGEKEWFSLDIGIK